MMPTLQLSVIIFDLVFDPCNNKTVKWNTHPHKYVHHGVDLLKFKHKSTFPGICLLYFVLIITNHFEYTICLTWLLLLNHNVNICNFPQIYMLKAYFHPRASFFVARIHVTNTQLVTWLYLAFRQVSFISLYDQFQKFIN